MTIKNMIGSKYGKLTVLREGELYIHVKSMTTTKKWICECECGNIIEVRQDSLRSRNTQSCGCISTGKTSNKKDKNRNNR